MVKYEKPPRIEELFQLSFSDLQKMRYRLESFIEEVKNSELGPDTPPISEHIMAVDLIDRLLGFKDPSIEEKALEIMRTGNPMDYIIGVYNKIHVGDTYLGKIMLLSIACQSAISSDGIQPKLTGSSGKGKTHAAKAMFHLIPDLEYKMMGSLSAKTLFYKPDIMPGTIIFTDDVKISEDLDSTLKQAMSNFQEPTIHRTVIKQGYSELTIPPRTVFWMTSVNTDFSDELINRGRVLA